MFTPKEDEVETEGSPFSNQSSVQVHGVRCSRPSRSCDENSHLNLKPLAYQLFNKHLDRELLIKLISRKKGAPIMEKLHDPEIYCFFITPKTKGIAYIFQFLGGNSEVQEPVLRDPGSYHTKEKSLP